MKTSTASGNQQIYSKTRERRRAYGGSGLLPTDINDGATYRDTLK